ncbi:MAG: hypothetical protein AAF266_10750, partial [Planctomycetota bacterium]
ISGTEFFLDGTSVEGLAEGTSIDFEQRDAILTGTLADGSDFRFDLSSTNTTFGGFFSPDARLTLFRVPEPTTASLVMLLATHTVLCRTPARGRKRLSPPFSGR